jgi:hypothetical protein
LQSFAFHKLSLLAIQRGFLARRHLHRDTGW